MPAESSHHKTKKRRYNLLLVPSDDAGDAKTIRFAPWQALLLSGGTVVFIMSAVLLILFYTPVGILIPIPNPELENKYGKELLSLNQRMNTLMQELVVLRQYNLKLRSALGENVVQTDSGLAPLTGLAVSGTVRRSASREAKKEQAEKTMAPTASAEALTGGPRLSMIEGVAERRQVVAFPALFPTEGYVTRGYNVHRRHFGLDIAGKMGTPVHAAADGNVVFAGWTNEDGYAIIISHSGGFLTFYKHNQSLLKAAGAFVRRGQPIALLGNSGETSSGPHVHFEIWKDGTPVDPAPYILNLHF